MRAHSRKNEIIIDGLERVQKDNKNLWDICQAIVETNDRVEKLEKALICLVEEQREIMKILKGKDF